MTSETEGNLALRRYSRSESVVFHKTKERFGGLSNMASGFPLFVDGVYIATSEALYQACRFPHLPAIQEKIILERSPMTAKMKSKPYRHQSRSDWEDIRFKVMRWCLRVKLAQNYEKFSDLLLSTENRPIVEQSWKDDYWGAKVGTESDEYLVGQNVLGRLLMELRELLKIEQEQLKIVPALNVSDFLLYGKPIPVVEAGQRTEGHSDESQPDLF